MSFQTGFFGEDQERRIQRFAANYALKAERAGFKDVRLRVEFVNTASCAFRVESRGNLDFYIEFDKLKLWLESWKPIFIVNLRPCVDQLAFNKPRLVSALELAEFFLEAQYRWHFAKRRIAGVRPLAPTKYEEVFEISLDGSEEKQYLTINHRNQRVFFGTTTLLPENCRFPTGVELM